MGKSKKFCLRKILHRKDNKIKNRGNFLFLPYQVVMKLNDLPNNIKAKKFKIEDDEVTFLTNHQGLLEIEQRRVVFEFENVRKKYLRYLLMEKWLTLLSLMLITFIFATSNHYIREVAFVNESDYSEEVYEYVVSNLTKSGPIYRLNRSLNEISIDMRSRFPYYAWIGLSKNGGCLQIEVEKQDANIIKEPDNSPGHLIASKDGYIISFNVVRGIVLISPLETVKKGAMLVDANIHHHNETKPPLYVHSEGEVLARTITLEKVSVKLEEEILGYTGKFKENKYFKLGSFHSRIVKKPYQEAKVEEKILFKIGNFFSIRKRVYYEKKLIKTVYGEISAIKFAKTMVEKEFYKITRSKKEKIVSQDIIEIVKTENEFIIKLLVMRIENIATFTKIDS